MEKGEKMFMYEKGKKSFGIVILLYIFIGPLAGFYIGFGTGLLALFIVGIWDLIAYFTFLEGDFLGGIKLIFITNWIGVIPVFICLKAYNEKLRKILYEEYDEEKEEKQKLEQLEKGILEKKIGLAEITFLIIISFLIIVAFILW